MRIIMSDQMSNQMNVKRNVLIKEYEEKYPNFREGRKLVKNLIISIIIARTISAVISISCFIIRGFPVSISYWIFAFSILGSFLVVLMYNNNRIAFRFYAVAFNGIISLFIIFDDVKQLISTGSKFVNIMAIFYLLAVIYEIAAILIIIFNYKCAVYFNFLPDIKKELKDKIERESLKNMKKLPIFIAILFFFIVLGLVYLVREKPDFFQFGRTVENASDTGQADWESAAVKTEEEITYTNAYLGFSYTIPKDWWLYDINDDNFNPDPSYTASPEILDIDYGTNLGFDYNYIDLCYFANLRDSRKDNHIGYYIYAETLDGIDTLEEYMEYLRECMLRPDKNTYESDTGREMLNGTKEVINGIQYEKRFYVVVRQEASNFILVTYTRPARENYYLTIKANYWPNNRNAETFISDSLTKAMP